MPVPLVIRFPASLIASSEFFAFVFFPLLRGNPIAIRPPAVFHRPLECLVIHVDQPEALPPAHVPFEVVEQRPAAVAADIGAVGQCTADLLEVGGEIFNAVWVADAAVGILSLAGTDCSAHRGQLQGKVFRCPLEVKEAQPALAPAAAHTPRGAGHDVPALDLIRGKNNLIFPPPALQLLRQVRALYVCLDLYGILGR